MVSYVVRREKKVLFETANKQLYDSFIAVLQNFSKLIFEVVHKEAS